MIDYRRLNQCTVKDVRPLPRSDDVLEAVGGTRWLSCLDLASGYWQMPVAAKIDQRLHFPLTEASFNGK